MPKSLLYKYIRKKRIKYNQARCKGMELLAEGDTLQLSGLTLRVLHTPGHTPGSVCLMAEDTLFTGDTLFMDSCGRTDLPGGSTPVILQSLKRLAALEQDYRVLPGHGPATTLSQEKQFNPYMN